MRLVDHVLLASTGVLEHPTAEEAKVAELDALCDVGQQSFEADHTVYILDKEGMSLAHVVEAALDTRALLVAEETDTEGVEGGLLRKFAVFLVLLGFMMLFG